MFFHFSYQAQFPLSLLPKLPPTSPHPSSHPLLREGKASHGLSTTSLPAFLNCNLFPSTFCLWTFTFLLTSVHLTFTLIQWLAVWLSGWSLASASLGSLLLFLPFSQISPSMYSVWLPAPPSPLPALYWPFSSLLVHQGF